MFNFLDLLNQLLFLIFYLNYFMENQCLVSKFILHCFFGFDIANFVVSITIQVEELKFISGFPRT